MVFWYMKELLKKIVGLTGYSLVPTRILKDPQRQRPIKRDDFFNLYFSKVDPAIFFFVQIGANDGKSSDPIYPYVTKYCLSGITVEPQPDAFALLTETYRDYPGVTCVQAAVGEHSGTIPFYTVKESAKTKENQFPMTRIASFNKASIRRGLRKKIPPGANPEDYIQEVPVVALSFVDFMEQYAIQKVNFLQIDCEGYDYTILKTIDMAALAPEILNYESCLFSDAERAECEGYLVGLGYSLFRYGDDTCAYKLS